MKFNDYITIHSVFSRLAKREGSRVVEPIRFYETLLAMKNHDFNSHVAQIQLNSELNWYIAARPYYNVYPNITRHLIRVHEEKIPIGNIKLPHEALVFRFADSDKTFRFTWENQPYQLLNMLVSYSKNQKEILLWMDFGERVANDPIHVYRKLVIKEGFSVDQAMNALAMDEATLSMGVKVPQEIINDAVRCMISCTLISRDLEEGLIEPDVLTKDKEAWERTHDPKYVEKAIRRGKKSWNIGEKMVDVSPSYRSPSPLALYWTGVGRSIPLLRYRRGTWVKRKKIAEMPHGYLGDQ